MPFNDTAPITGFVPSSSRVNLTEHLTSGHDAMNWVDWFWRNFLSDRGEGCTRP